MAKSITQPGRKLALTLLRVQVLVVSLATILVAFLSTKQAAISFFAGGLICIVPGVLFALLFFAHSGAAHLKVIMRSFYRGEVIKIAATIILFAMIYQWPAVQAGFLLAGYILALVTEWLVKISYQQH